MRQSKLFTKTRREAPADEVSKNAQLLIRAGYIHKEMAGAYDLLPLGLRVIEKIRGIIREEMNAIGGQELSLTALQDPEIWKKTDRWDDDVIDNWFKTDLKNETEVGLAFTHEEPLTNLMRDHIASYRDLPAYAYQFQTKFRNEARAKSGIMRTREFIMKDLYSFSKDEGEHLDFYEKAKQAYIEIFRRIGIGDKTHFTLASGGSFSEFSHEFQTVTDAGEDIIYIHENGTAINKEIFTEETKERLGLDDSFTEVKSVEVGNIFTLGTKYSDMLGLKYKNDSGEDLSVFMGSYGIGLGRLMGTVVEVLSDEKGIVWPASVAPFGIHLVSLVTNDEVVVAYAEALYEELTAAGIEVLYDDRDARAGEKLADADLIGIPTRVLVGKDTIASGAVEVVDRATGEVKKVTRGALLAHMSGVAAAG